MRNVFFICAADTVRKASFRLCCRISAKRLCSFFRRKCEKRRLSFVGGISEGRLFFAVAGLVRNATFSLLLQD